MSEQETLLEFPCEFPIKVMGRADDDFQALVTGIVRRHAPDLSDEAVKVRASHSANYLAVTVVVQAVSRDQLDDIYRELTAREEVLMAL